VALVRVPFYFINLWLIPDRPVLLYIPVLLTYHTNTCQIALLGVEAHSPNLAVVASRRHAAPVGRKRHSFDCARKVQHFGGVGGARQLQFHVYVGGPRGRLQAHVATRKREPGSPGVARRAVARARRHAAHGPHCSRLHLRLQHVHQVDTVRLALPIHHTPWLKEDCALARPPRGVERRRRGAVIGVPVLVVGVLPHHRLFLGPRSGCGGHCIRGVRLFVPQIHPIACPPAELLLDACLPNTVATAYGPREHKVRDRGLKLHHEETYASASLHGARLVVSRRHHWRLTAAIIGHRAMSPSILAKT